MASDTARRKGAGGSGRGRGLIVANPTNPDVHHISTLALNMLFKARNKNLCWTQGGRVPDGLAPEKSTTTMSRLGVCLVINSREPIWKKRVTISTFGDSLGPPGISCPSQKPGAFLAWL
ncbi:hypothetical protein V8E54_000492 [Elaphomyces granulatus]